MPTYEYECLKCGKIFEKFQKMSDSHLRECPKCRGQVKRLISAGSGLIFKGSGFYITDYKKKRTSVSSDKKEKPKPCSDCAKPECPNAPKKEKS
jgi:putative FmdB family regulatory protein